MRWILIALFGLIVLFFALTRTDAGRDALRSQIEREFDRTFDGRLSIDRLTGNVVGSLHATNVVLRGSREQEVAAIDSVVIRPRWRDLLSRTLSIRSVELYSPRLTLVKMDSAEWNLTQALSVRADRGQRSMGGWSLMSASVLIENGAVTTFNAVAEAKHDPIDWWSLFDYQNTAFESLSALATIEIRDHYKLIDLLHFSVDAPAMKLADVRMRGQLVVDGPKASLNRFKLQLPESHIQLTGTYESGGLSGWYDAPLLLDDGHGDLTIYEARFDFDELRTVFPALPLHHVLDLSGNFAGRPDELSFEEISLSDGRTSFLVEGDVKGLPHRAEIDFSVSSQQAELASLNSWFSGGLFEDFSHIDEVSLRTSGSAIFDKPAGGTPLQLSLLRGHAEGTSPSAGSIAAEFDLRSSRGSGYELAANLEVTHLDVGYIYSDSELASDLSGEVTFSGRGHRMNALSTDFDIRLAPSYFSGRRIDHLAATVASADSQYTGSVVVHVGEGTVSGTGSLTRGDGLPGYQADLSLQNLDLGHLVLNDSLVTSLNMTVGLSGSGFRARHMRGSMDLIVDSSLIGYADRIYEIPPTSTQITLRDDSDGRPLLTGDGDMVRFNLAGTYEIDALVETVRLWTSGYSAGLQQTFNKPLHQPGFIRSRADPALMISADAFRPDAYGPVPQEDSAPQDLSFQRGHVRQVLADAGLMDGISANLHMELNRAEIISALIPGLPLTRSYLELNVSLEGDDRILSYSVDISADSIMSRDTRADSVFVQLGSSGEFGDSAWPVIRADMTVTSALTRLAGQDFERLSVSAAYGPETGHLSVDAARLQNGGTLDLRASLEQLTDRNRLHVDDFTLQIRDRIWKAVNDRYVDLYSEALVFHNLAFENAPLNGEGELSVIRLNGTISSVPGDTAFVSADQIRLEEVSDILDLGNWGGELNARIAVTAAAAGAEATGLLTVEDFRLDNRMLGFLTVSSDYAPAREALVVDLSLQQPENVEVWQRNDVEISGTVNLNPNNGSDIFDLSVNLNRIDLFFFEFIFPDIIEDVEAYATGSGTIRGSFAYPRFDGRFAIPSGRFYIPDFNLEYALEGPFTVDAEGFHLQDVLVSDPTGGTAFISGGILFNEYRFFSLDLTGALENLRIMNVSASRELPFYGHIWLSGDATLRGSLDNTELRSSNLVAHRQSELSIPVTGGGLDRDEGFILFADSSGVLPDFEEFGRRTSVLGGRPVGERSFLDGMEMNLNIEAPRGSTIRLVFDPLLGDVINAVGSGRIQLQRTEGTFSTFGTFNVESGDYLFTAGEVFTRRFILEPGGTISWEGDPIDASLAIPATFRTRASLAGLPGYENLRQRVPLLVRLEVSGRVESPVVDLRLSVAQDDRTSFGTLEGLEAVLNQTDRAAEYATSVLLTNTFLLTTETGAESLTGTADELLFNSLSQLVANQLNRFVNQALTNVEFMFGVQSANTQDLDLTYGVALRLLDERLIIRGEGIYESASARRNTESLQGEFVVEVRLNPRVSVEVFYRREEDLSNFTSLTSSMYGAYGAGVSYQTDFISWSQFWQQISGWFKGLFSNGTS